MIPVLGAAGAARLARWQLEHTIRIVRGAGLDRVTLWAEPGCWHPALQAHKRRHGLRLRTQASGDLGARMLHAARFAHGKRESAILLGTDCPDLRTRDLISAAAALNEGADVVIGPAVDGGYYLLGMRRPFPTLFRAMPWGTDAVFRLTLKRLRQGKWDYVSLPVRNDLDRPSDLRGRSPHAAGRPSGFPVKLTNRLDFWYLCRS